jgi:hypothetical protein
MRSALVFPHPLGPTRTTNSPSSISRSRSDTARVPSAVDLRQLVERDLRHACARRLVSIPRRGGGCHRRSAAGEALDERVRAPGSLCIRYSSRRRRVRAGPRGRSLCCLRSG